MCDSNMLIWDKKIAAILHDPLTKVFDITNHVIKAKLLAEAILESLKFPEERRRNIIECIEKHHDKSKSYYLKQADTESSAANRSLIPKDSKHNIVEIVQPFSSYKLKDIKKLDPIRIVKDNETDNRKLNETLVEKIREIYFNPVDWGFPNGPPNGNSKGWYRYYYKFVRTLLEFYKREIIGEYIYTIPEDTRMPTSPMISHLLMTSALAPVVNETGKPGLNGYLIRFDLGGVQEFISKSRKTRDFWFSSLLLSTINYAFMKHIVEKYGFDAIIYPWLIEIPIVDLHHKYISDVDEFMKKLFMEKLLYPVIPNSYLAVIPKDGRDPKSILKDIVKEAENVWEHIVGTYWKKLEKVIDRQKVQELKKTVCELSFSDVFKKIRFSIIELPDDIIDRSNNWSKLRELIEKLKDEELVDAKLEHILDETYCGNKKLREEFLEYSGKKVLGRYYTITKLSQLDLLAKKYLQQAEFNVRPSGTKLKQLLKEENSKKSLRKCDACGLNPIVPLEENDWKELEKRNIVDIDERLCHLDLLKRLIPKRLGKQDELLSYDETDILDIFKPFNEELIEELKIRRKLIRVFPSTEDFSTIWFRVTLLLFSKEIEVKKVLKNIYSIYDKIRKKRNELEMDLGEESRRILDRIDPPTELEELTKLRNELEERFPLIRKLSEILKGENPNYGNEPEILVAYLPSTLLDKTEVERKIHGLTSCRNKCNDNINVYIELLEELNKELGNLYDRLKEILRNKVWANIKEAIKCSQSDAGVIHLEPLLKAIAEILRIGNWRKLREILTTIGIDLIPLSSEPTNSYVLVRSDGDSMGKWLSGENLPNFYLGYAYEVAKKYIEMICKEVDEIKNCDENFLKEIESLLDPKFKRLLTPAIQSTISMVLSRLAVEVYPKIVEAFGGKLVYSGGDDVFAYLPPETWWIASTLIRTFYSSEFISIKELIVRFEEKEDSSYTRVLLPGMSHRASMSFGVVIANTKADLRYVIQKAGDLEESSKSVHYDCDGEAKDGLSVISMSRSSIKAKVIGVPWFIIRVKDCTKENCSELLLLKEFLNKHVDKIIGERKNYTASSEQCKSFIKDYLDDYYEKIKELIKEVGGSDTLDYAGMGIKKLNSWRKSIYIGPLEPLDFYWRVNIGELELNRKVKLQSETRDECLEKGLVFSKAALYDVYENYLWIHEAISEAMGEERKKLGQKEEISCSQAINAFTNLICSRDFDVRHLILKGQLMRRSRTIDLDSDDKDHIMEIKERMREVPKRYIENLILSMKEFAKKPIILKGEHDYKLSTLADIYGLVKIYNDSVGKAVLFHI